MDKVLVIAGPTAVGKTAFSIECAKQFNGEIISGDSMQVYRSLDIGTAKVTEEEKEGIPHHLIDIMPSDGSFSAADFQRYGRKAIADITKRNKLPIIVGGTGLYLQTLLYDFHLGGQEVSIPQAKKEELTHYLDEYGPQCLWDRLQKVDEKAAAAIHPNNTRRVLRALEVVEVTGKPFFQEKEELVPLYDSQLIVLNTERSLLYDRINQRVDLMMEQGLLEEASFVYHLEQGQGKTGIGYKEFIPYFEGKITQDEAVAQVKQNSRRYAKRQLTWFRNRMTGKWFDFITQPSDKEAAFHDIANWLEEE